MSYRLGTRCSGLVVHDGHRQVHDDDRRSRRGDALERLLPVGRFGNVEPGGRERHRVELSRVVEVIDDEHESSRDTGGVRHFQ